MECWQLLLSELSTNEITSIDFKFYNTFAPKNIGYLIFESDNLKCQKVFFYTYLFDFYLGELGNFFYKLWKFRNVSIYAIYDLFNPNS